MSERIPMLDGPVDGREIRLRCRRPDGTWVTLKALTYRDALDRLPSGWVFVGVADADVHAEEVWT